MVDATRIVPHLYQGAWPLAGDSLQKAGFKILVLCAREYQPPHELPPEVEAALEGLGAMDDLRQRWQDPFPGVVTIHAPNDDNSRLPVERRDLAVALQAARKVSSAVKQRQNVLVTCWQGRNRSGLVSALALHMLMGCGGAQAAEMVKRARRGALTNSKFVELLDRIECT